MSFDNDETLRKIKSAYPIEDHITSLGAKIQGGGDIRKTNRCPLKQHGKDHFCVSVNILEQWFKCHSCVQKGTIVRWIALEQNRNTTDVFKELAQSLEEEKPVSKNKDNKKERVVATYDYTDQIGELLYQVVRYEPKTFKQRQPDCNNGWTWNMNGVTRVLYHLPEVMAANLVIVVEGEKDADNLRNIGFTATTSVGGAKNWLDSYADYLGLKDVVVIPDNDKDGKEYAKNVVDSLTNKALSVKVMPMPLPHKDASDYLYSLADPVTAFETFSAMIENTPHVIKPVPLFTIEELEARYKKTQESSSTRTFDLGKFLPSLGESVRKLIPGQLVTIMAGTSVGKTAIMQNMAKAAAPLVTLFFELELPHEDVFERFVQIDRGCFASDVEEDYKDGNALLAQNFTGLQHILTCAESGLAIGQIEDIIRRSELKTGQPPCVVFIDYIGLIGATPGMGRSRYEIVSYAAEQLKVIAKRTETIMIIGTQIARPSKDSTTLEVGLHDSKDSGSIENSSGLVLGAWRPERDILMMKILKNTKGVTGREITCNFDGSRMRITERSKIDAEDVPSHNGSSNGHYHHPEPEPELPQQEFEDYQATHPDP